MGRTTRRTTGTLTFDSNVQFNTDTANIINATADNLTTSDNIITLNKNQNTLTTSGIEIDKSGAIQASLIYNDAGSGSWVFAGASQIDMGSASLSNFSVSSLTNLTVTNFVSNNVDIGGGAIDGTTIGATTPAGASFTTINASGAITGSVTGTVSSIANHDTDALSEGSTNLYYTNARADARIAAANTDNLSEGTTNLYFTNARADGRFDVKLAAADTGNLSEGSNLYFTNARADARITASSINALSDVDTSGVATNHVLQWNGTAFVPASIGNSFANIVTDKDTSTSAVTGATLQNEAASGLTVPLTPQDSSAKILVQSNIKYSVQSSTGSTAFYIRLWRDKGNPHGYTPSTEKLLAEDVVYEATNTATIYQTNFSVFDTTGDTNAHTYTVYYDASTANGTLTPNPTHSQGSASENYILASEQIITGDIVTLTGSNTLTNKTLTSPTITSPVINTGISGTAFQDDDSFASASSSKVASSESIKAYVDAQVQSKDTLGELNDVDTTGAANNKILKYNGTTWVVADDVDTDTGILNVVEDTTPQLGGALDAQGNNITGLLNVTGTGVSQFRDGTYTGNLTVSGNLTVEGETTTIDVTQLEVDDPMIYLNRNASDNANNTYDSGILIERGSTEDHAGMIWQESTDRFKFLTSTGITATTTVVPSITLADIEAGTAHMTATSAQYADLAELYTSDTEYDPGTVVIFGGSAEVTQSTTSLDHKIAGVVSTNPAYLMNKDQSGTTVAVALRGKVPVNIIGPVKKGDLIVTSDTPGVGKAHPGVTNCVYVIGKCIEDDDTENLVRLINCVI